MMQIHMWQQNSIIAREMMQYAPIHAFNPFQIDTDNIS
jgi:hypothetical protein